MAKLKPTKNSPEVWDKIYDVNVSLAEDKQLLEMEKSSIRYQRIEAAMVRHFGDINGLNILEIGAGTGTYSALFAQKGAKITIVDYSEFAIKRSKEFFKRHGVKASYIKADALNLPQSLYGKFDVSMSFGLTEHFVDEDRYKINKAHIDVLRDGGMTIISVPNKLNAPYRWYKYRALKAGTWEYGEEYPYSRFELSRIFNDLGVVNQQYAADSLIASFDYFGPYVKVRSMFSRGYDSEQSPLTRKNNYPTLIDCWISYALVFIGIK